MENVLDKKTLENLFKDVNPISMEELERKCTKVSERKLFSIYLVFSNDEKVTELKEKYPFLEWKKEKKTSTCTGRSYCTNVCDMKLSWKELKKLEKDGIVDIAESLENTSIFAKRWI